MIPTFMNCPFIKTLPAPFVWPCCRTKLVTGLFLGLFLLFMPSAAAHPVDIDEAFGALRLGGRHLDLLEDKNKDLTIDDVASGGYSDAFTTNEQAVINLGYTSAAHWIRFTLHNRLDEESVLLLEVAYALLDSVSLFSQTPDNTFIETEYGQRVLFDEREIKHRHFIFELVLPPQASRTFYLRVETEDSFTLPMMLYSRNEFIHKEQSEQLVLGLFYGALLIMLLYNLVVYASAKEKNYLYLVLFILSFLIYIMSENGIAYQYLWPNLPWWSKRALPFCVSMVIITSSLFIQSFIETKRHAPRINRLIVLFRVLGVVGLMFALVAGYFFSIIYIVLVVLAYSPVLLAAGYIAMRKGSRSAIFFLAAWAFLLLGSFAYGLKAFGLLPETFITKNGVSIGAIIQMALLSLGLADKINAMRHELTVMNKNLETKIEKRTEDLAKANTILKSEIIDRKNADAALRESELRFRSLFDSSPIAMALSGIETDKFIDVNDKFCELVKCSKEEILGSTPLELGFYSREAKHRFAEAFRKTGAVQGMEMDFHTRDHAIINALIYAKPIRVSKEPFMIMTFYDVTDKKKLEDQLRQTQKMESIGTLAGGIAHDFNNILFPIVGYAEMTLDKVPEGSRAQKNLYAILDAAMRARDLVQQILTFSRKGEQEYKPLMIQLVIKEAIKLLRSSIPKTIEIKHQIDNHCGLIMGDPTQIHQIMMNLCTNAYHAMEKTGGTLDVTLDEVEFTTDDIHDPDEMAPGRYVRLSVSDTGKGMAPEIVEKIFDPYFTTKETGKGTGLGLSVTHGIIKNIGGCINVYTEVGKGSVFHVYLPVIERQKKSDETMAPPTIQTGNEHILLVDDEEPIVELEKQMLERLGYKVTPRTSSVEALQAFRANPDNFQLVITDMTMPNMTGTELVEQLIDIKQDIPIVICTGFSEQMSDEKAKRIGVRALVMKPIIINDLAQKVRDVLDDAQKQAMVIDSGER